MGTGIVTWNHKVPEREPARQASRHGGMLEPSAPRKNRCLGLSWPRGQREVSFSELYSGSQFSPAVGVRKWPVVHWDIQAFLPTWLPKRTAERKVEVT